MLQLTRTFDVIAVVLVSITSWGDICPGGVFQSIRRCDIKDPDPAMVIYNIVALRILSEIMDTKG